MESFALLSTRAEWSGTEPEDLQGVGVYGMHNKAIKNYKKNCQYHLQFCWHFEVDGRSFF